MRKITSLSLGFSFLIMSYTGIILFVAPHGRVSRWLDWHLFGLDKVQYQELHNTSMITLLFFGILHIYYNWKPIVNYLKDSTKKISFTKKEFLIAFILNAFFVIGTLTHIQPFKGFLDLGETFKSSWSENITKTSSNNNTNVEVIAIKPPPQRLGRKTLQELSDMGNINLEYALKALKSKGINNINSNIKIKDIANELNIEKSDVYKLITE
ncbi:DUF4405 domain-containing membrane protein [Malaciobacter marinus]|uniref:DUF4405 domain-containing membrane protein n=1 Tax=Malaciobacter marinus TaxID=505249 RepID=A0A347TKG7_9BACT|nr:MULTISPECIES: DUF4405 domain-containing protein [Malaciobacter]AXX87095.1 DUF4405 domain-containing membrane protein [Malaciobacter marinus]PHO12315.1 hypothetical protein CPG38_08715 [Malaciobacter marinus]PHO16306.1 hypothetical protein CPH92_02225 [Malaciobacter marinus]RYA22889.1 DUF4405 domain-containing protein [Malaciobacter halophilus]